MQEKRDNILEIGNGNDVVNQKNAMFSSIFNRTEKVTTALYMVTDLFLENEPLRLNLRTRAMALLGKIAQVDNMRPTEKHVLFEECQNILREIISNIRISATLGMISEMNTAIILREYTSLNEEIRQFQRENKESYFSSSMYTRKVLSDFTVKENINIETILSGQAVEKPSQGEFSYKGQIHKGQNVVNPESKIVKQGDVPFKQNSEKPVVTSLGKKDIGLKINRRSNILMIIKDKGEVNIKSISELIKDCSEKTIQRELNGMVGEGVLKRTGDKRWSKYSLK